MTLREAIARWLCPKLGKDADCWWRAQTDVDHLKRWLGHDFPVVEVSLDHLMIGVRNWSRSLNEKPIVHEYAKLGCWPTETNVFRDKLRATFPQQHKDAA